MSSSSGTPMIVHIPAAGHTARIPLVKDRARSENMIAATMAPVADRPSKRPRSEDDDKSRTKKLKKAPIPIPTTPTLPEAIAAIKTKKKTQERRAKKPAFKNLQPLEAIKASMEKKKKRDSAADTTDRSKPAQPELGSTSAAASPAVNGATQSDTPEDNSPAGLRAALERTRVELLKTRKKLPIWRRADDIRSALGESGCQVLILTGATGSGKSTQIPQFLVNEPWMDPANAAESKTKVKAKKHQASPYRTGCVVVTQPRRVAAVGLARRVSAEMGVRLGRSATGWTDRTDESEISVGCSVRFDNNVSHSSAVATRIKFATEGMVLRELGVDTTLDQYGCVVVDEVHERSVDVDVLLGFLRQIVTGVIERKRNRPLKVVVMSATAEVAGLYRFFAEGFAAARGISIPPDASLSDLLDFDLPISTVEVEGRMFPVRISYLPAPVISLYDAVLEAVRKIQRHEPLPGDVLVFLPGRDPIELMSRLLEQEPNEFNGRRLAQMAILPLYGALPVEAQQLIFTPAPAGIRRIILATNIAETSVTVPGVRHVIDCGKAKIKTFHSTIRLASLIAKPISKSSAIQRTGRAGREGPGTCARLYTASAFADLSTAPIPEILRADLAGTVLTLKSAGVSDLTTFPLLDPVPGPEVDAAIALLTALGALDPKDDSVTSAGRTISRLPVSPMLGAILVAAAEGQDAEVTLAAAIDIVAVLSVEPVFVDAGSDEARARVADARAADGLIKRAGDHESIVAVMRAYAGLRQSSGTGIERTESEKAWASRVGISLRAIRQAWDVREQLRREIKPSCVSPTADGTGSGDKPANDLVLVETTRCPPLLAALLTGFGTQMARILPDGAGYETLIGRRRLVIHPSSVLFGRRPAPPMIVFSEHVFTTKSYGRVVSSVPAEWADAVVDSWVKMVEKRGAGKQTA